MERILGANGDPKQEITLKGMFNISYPSCNKNV